MTLAFEGPVWYWKGPAPHHFVTVPPDEARQIKEVEPLLTYGWGMIPVRVLVGGTEWTTSLWPKDGLYIVPIRAAVRKAEGIAEGDTVLVRLEMELGR